MERFIDLLPVINEKLPLCEDGNLISISFFIFNKDSSRDNPHGHGGKYARYLKELTYAYRQLVNCTNILDHGRVRIFIDTRLYHYALPLLTKVGLDPLIVWVSIPHGCRLSGYILLFEDPSVSECHYRFNMDVDQFFITMIDQPAFDFKNFCSVLDTYSDNCIYGRDVTGGITLESMLRKYGHFTIDNDVFHSRDYDTDQYKSREDKIRLSDQKRAEMHFDRIFHGNIPSLFQDIIKGAEERFKGHNFVTGQFTGVRKDSHAANLIHTEYLRHGYSDIYCDDEAFLFSYLYRNPEIQLCNILQPRHLAEEGMIRETWMNDGEIPNNGHHLDIDTHVSMNAEYEGNRNKILTVSYTHLTLPTKRIV